MVQYRYIYIVALCTVCIDLYIGMYRLPGPGGGPALTGLPSPAPSPAAGHRVGSGQDPVLRDGVGGRRRCTRQHQAASWQTWPQAAVGWEASPSRDGYVPQPPRPTGRLSGRGGWQCGGAGWSHGGSPPALARGGRLGGPRLAEPRWPGPRRRRELGGQQRHEEERGGHGQGQVFPLGAGAADALLQLGHLWVEVFCGEEREGEGGTGVAPNPPTPRLGLPRGRQRGGRGAAGPGAVPDSPRSSIFTSGRRVNCGRVGASFSPECDAARGREGTGTGTGGHAPWPPRAAAPRPGRDGGPAGWPRRPPARPQPPGRAWGVLTGGAAHEHLHLQAGPAVVVRRRGCKARAGWGGSGAGDPSPRHPEAQRAAPRWVWAHWGLALPGGALRAGGDAAAPSACTPVLHQHPDPAPAP